MEEAVSVVRLLGMYLVRRRRYPEVGGVYTVLFCALRSRNPRSMILGRLSYGDRHSSTVRGSRVILVRRR
jgi:hypothetical protein